MSYNQKFVTENKPAPGRPVITASMVRYSAEQGRVPLFVAALIHNVQNKKK
jgi:hypothetical protein